MDTGIQNHTQRSSRAKSWLSVCGAVLAFGSAIKVGDYAGGVIDEYRSSGLTSMEREVFHARERAEEESRAKLFSVLHYPINVDSTTTAALDYGKKACARKIMNQPISCGGGFIGVPIAIAWLSRKKILGLLAKRFKSPQTVEVKPAEMSKPVLPETLELVQRQPEPRSVDFFGDVRKSIDSREIGEAAAEQVSLGEQQGESSANSSEQISSASYVETIMSL